MSNRINTHIRGNLIAYLALFVALGGTGAWAADKITSKDIAKNAVRAKHIKKNAVTAAKIAPTFVQGRGTVLSNRLVSVPLPSGVGEVTTLLRIPGLGELRAECRRLPVSIASIHWANTTAANIDVWSEADQAVSVVPAGFTESVASFMPTQPADDDPFAAFALGRGNDPGARTIATVHAFPFQQSDGAPCGFQAQATLWKSK